MATINVTITSKGTFAPAYITPNPGDTVAFFADDDDVVLCVDPEKLFGEERYEIPDGTTRDLVVQEGAVHVDFGYIAILGDLNAACEGKGRGEGGGQTGP